MNRILMKFEAPVMMGIMILTKTQKVNSNHDIVKEGSYGKAQKSRRP